MPDFQRYLCANGYARWLRLAASLGLGAGLVAGLLGLLARPAQAAACTVPGTYATIQLAINDAGCDTITVTGGPYLEHLSIGRNVEIYGTGATIVDGSLTGRVVNITGNFTVLISGTILQRGSNAGNGGGINNLGQLTLINSQVLSSTAKNGGGIYNDQALTANNVIVRRNTISSSIAFGGGIYNGPSATLLLNGGLIVSNVITAAIGEGGGVYNLGTAGVLQTLIAGNAISGNQGFGGGLYNLGTASVVNTVVAQNLITAGLAFGGGVLNSDGADLTIQGSQVTTNSLRAIGGQGFGGGLNNSGRLTATNVVAAGNLISASIAYGGGLHNDSDGQALWAFGQVAFNKTDDDGGGIYNDGSLLLGGATLHDNQVAGNGGGIRNIGIVLATNARLESNRANDGAGLYNSGTYTGANDTLIQNTASDDGGGVFNSSGSLWLNRAVFNSNIAGGASGEGGGLYVSGGNILLSEANMVNNAAVSKGGGLFAGAAVTLSNVTIDQNDANDGAGIYVNSDVLNATNLTLFANSGFGAGSDAGGLYLSSSAQAALVHATVASNTVAGGNAAGIVLEGGAVLTLTNSILSGNENANCAIFGTLTETGANLEDADDCGLAGPLINTNPLLGGLAFNGGIPTAALKAGSPALDAAALPQCASTDARGVARPQGAGCDLGAYEALLLSVADSAVVEGDAGSTLLVFTATVGGLVPGPQSVTATYSITGGTATAGVDFLAASGTVVIPNGQQFKQITVTVLGDLDDELAETFTLTLSSPTHALLDDAEAIGTIVDDDELHQLFLPLVKYNYP